MLEWTKYFLFHSSENDHIIKMTIKIKNRELEINRQIFVQFGLMCISSKMKIRELENVYR